MFDLMSGRRRLRRGLRAFVRERESDSVRVFVDHGFQWDGSANVWLTRARASFVVQAGPAFDVRPRGAIGRLLGFHGGVPSGDPCFDYFFAVRTPAAVETWCALTTHARSLLAGELEDAHLVSDGHMITLWREGDFGREIDATAAIEIVHEVARHRVDALDALRRLPGATYLPATGPWDERLAPAVELASPAAVRIGPIAHHGRAVTVVSAPCGRAERAFAVDLDGEQLASGSELADQLADAALEVGASGLACDGSRIMLRWPALETRRDLLLAGAELVSRVAIDQVGGVYH